MIWTLVGDGSVEEGGIHWVMAIDRGREDERSWVGYLGHLMEEGLLMSVVNLVQDQDSGEERCPLVTGVTRLWDWEL